VTDDQNNTIRRVMPDGTIRMEAGGNGLLNGFAGDGAEGDGRAGEPTALATQAGGSAAQNESAKSGTRIPS
jgi:hypothetical protein